jgi:hypothetical protein
VGVLGGRDTRYGGGLSCAHLLDAVCVTYLRGGCAMVVYLEMFREGLVEQRGVLASQSRCACWTSQ